MALNSIEGQKNPVEENPLIQKTTLNEQMAALREAVESNFRKNPHSLLETIVADKEARKQASKEAYTQVQ